MIKVTQITRTDVTKHRKKRKEKNKKALDANKSFMWVLSRNTKYFIQIYESHKVAKGSHPAHLYKRQAFCKLSVQPLNVTQLSR